jgi:tetratricopeptide (TPR) repeat protein
MSINPKNRVERRLKAAEGYLELELPHLALAALDEVKDPLDLHFEWHVLRGEALRHLERHDEALKAFQPAEREKPDNVPLLMAMAWCYKRTSQLPRAIASMERAYKASPKEPIILYNLSCYWSLAGNKTQALSWLGRALRMDKSLFRLIESETDFDPLRGDPDFQMLVRAVDGSLEEA